MKKRLIRISAAAILFAAAMIVNSVFSPVWWIELLIFIVPYLAVGYDVVAEAAMNILHGRVFDENFLMSVATIGAFFIGEYPEAVGVMLFYQVGELFQSYAVDKSRKSISELMDIRPDFANLKRNGSIITVDPNEVQVGDTIVVKAGEKIPLDGTVVVGRSMLDTSALTGESVPRECAEGDEVLSGCINQSGMLEIQVAKPFGESTVSKILDLVENASNKKSTSENFITRFAAIYTPVVVISAALLAVLPPLLVPGQQFSDWIYRALSFLVVSCPCALVISVPLSFFGGIGGASRLGILVKGSNYLEALAKTETVVFDKTGTLTKGVFEVRRIVPSAGMSRDELLAYAAIAESYSNHPISMSLRKAYGGKITPSEATQVVEIPGHGVSARVMGKAVLAGNTKLMERENIPFNSEDIHGTVVHVAVGGVYSGYIVIADEIKADAKAAIAALKNCGVRQTVMLTGDSKAVAEDVAGELGIDHVYSELLPGDKVDKLESLLEDTAEKSKLAFVGDGINDAPVLARADIGIAMGALGSDAAIEAADIVIMTDEPSKIATAIEISRKTLRICTQNIVFAIGVKILVLILVALGMSNMWEAVFADVGVAVIAILNAMRALKTNIKK